jgi:hypothetical protein
MTMFAEIFIPTFNRRPLLEQAIVAALGQDYPSFRVVVSDNCSTDGTEELVRSFGDPRLTYRRNETNLGDFGNARACIDAARGEVLAITHDDDRLHPAYLSTAVAALNAGHVAFASDVRLIAREGEPLQASLLSLTSDLVFERGMYFCEYVRSGLWFPCPTIALKWSIEAREQEVRAHALGRGAYGGNADVAAIVRLNSLGSVLLSSEVLADYRQHDAQMSRVDDFVGDAVAFFGWVAEFSAHKGDESNARLAESCVAAARIQLALLTAGAIDPRWVMSAVASLGDSSEVLVRLALAVIAVSYEFKVDAFDVPPARGSLLDTAARRWLLARLGGAGCTPSEALRRMGVGRVAVFGAMIVSHALVRDLTSSGVTVVAVLDGNPVRQGSLVAGVRVCSHDWLNSNLDAIDAVVLSSERDRYDEVVSALMCRGLARDRVLCWKRLVVGESSGLG